MTHQDISNRLHSAANTVHQEVSHAVDSAVATSVRTLRGTVAGCIGGLVASWVMYQYMKIEERPVSIRKNESTAAPNEAADESASEPQSEQMREAQATTVKAARRVSRKLFDHELSPAQAKVAGPAVHFGYGTLVGGLYGGLAELLPRIGMGIGVPYATALWLAGNEIAVPAAGLSKPPTEKSAKVHASALASHFVYGLTLDITRRIVRRLI